MRKPITVTINIMAPILIAATLWLGFTGRVNWWVIFLVWLHMLEITYRFQW